MRELTSDELQDVSGGIVWLKLVEITLVAVGASDFIRDAYNGYNDGYSGK